MKKALSFILAFVFVFGVCLSAPITANAAKLPEPQITSVTSVSKGVKIEWEQLGDVEGYIIYKFVDGEYQQVAVQAPSNTMYIDQKAVSGETYTYAIASMDNIGNPGSRSEVTYKFCKVTSLSTPKVTVENTESGVKIYWNSIANADNYIIYKRTYNTSTKKWSGWSKLKTNYVGTSYVDTKVKLSQYYRYTVRAVCGDVVSSYKSTSTIKFSVVPTVKIANASNGISVKWNKIPSATGYTVYSATYNAKTKKWSGWSNRGTTQSTTSSWTDKQVKNGTIYRYTVRALYNGGKTNFKATSGLRFLTQPTVKIANVSNGIKVSWNKNTSATEYTVYRATLKNGNWSGWKNLVTTQNNVFSFVDKSAVSGEVYRYTVRTVNGGSKSSYKATANLMFLSQPKVTVSTSASGVKVNWTESLGAKNYAVYRSEYVDGEWTSWFKISTTSSLALTDGDALKGIKYKYTARAINGNFKSTYKASSAINGCVTPGSQGGVTGNVQPGGNDTYNDAILTDPLGAYQKAAKDIHLNGTAGYNKIGWQKILKIEGLGMLSGAIESIIAGFMTTEDEAETKVNAKSSDDAKNCMPISDCDKKYVKSANAEKLSNGNYKIVIVMNDVTNPSYEDTDGLVKMSREFLDMKDVMKEAANISIVKSLDGEINYVDYTITAEMTKDGKFVSITHQGIGYIKANLNGSINANGELEFYAKYTDFDYDGSTQPGDNTSETTDPILKDPFAAYRKAAKNIHENGVAGYNKKGWQTIEENFQFSNSALSSVYGDLMEGFLTTEADAEVKVNEKGSDDAKNRMPVSDCSKEYVKSATAKNMGDYYIITIVMKEQLNPSYADTDGLAKMSKEFLDVKDVETTVNDDATVSKIVKDIDAKINYKDYTITAKMTADGKFIEITHYGVGDMKVDMNANVVGNISGSGSIAFNARYYDFKY